MKTEVIIEAWSVDESYVHVHHRGFTDIHCRRGDLAAMTVDRFREIGLITGKLCMSNDGYSLVDGDCRELCEIAEMIDGYTVGQLIDAARQIEDSGFDVTGYDDSEIAYLDYMARELWADAARCYDDPFTNAMTLKCGIDSLLAGYQKRRNGNWITSEEA